MAGLIFDICFTLSEPFKWPLFDRPWHFVSKGQTIPVGSSQREWDLIIILVSLLNPEEKSSSCKHS